MLNSSKENDHEQPFILDAQAIAKLLSEYNIRRNNLVGCAKQKNKWTDEMIHTFFERLHYVYEYIGNETNLWLTVKKQLLYALPVELKTGKVFSKCKEVKHKCYYEMNQFEQSIADYWEIITDGVKLHIPEELRYDPTNLEKFAVLPYGAGLRIWQENRRKLKKEIENDRRQQNKTV